MCGIGGYFLRPGASLAADALDRMEAALAHRGPDGSGRYADAHAGIVHTRLSIVDLANGAQPFVAPPEDGGKVLAANGEIYNHAALRASHCAGYGFTSNSDCETVLALWARHGTAALRELRGMYAAALWDPQQPRGRPCPRPVRDQAALYRRNRAGHPLRIGDCGPSRGHRQHWRDRPGPCRLHHRQAICPGRPSALCRDPPRRARRDSDHSRRPDRRDIQRPAARRRWITPAPRRNSRPAFTTVSRRI